MFGLVIVIKLLIVRRFLLGGRSSSAQERLPEGAHEFPFEFSLPPSPNLPTSFEVRSINIFIMI